MNGACSSHGREEKQYTVLVRKSEGKRPIGRQRLRLEGNIKMAFKEWHGRGLTAFSWLKTGVGKGLLASTVTTYLLRKILETFSVGEKLSAAQEGQHSMELDG
jgi:hypothetical protein